MEEKRADEEKVEEAARKNQSFTLILQNYLVDLTADETKIYIRVISQEGGDIF